MFLSYIICQFFPLLVVKSYGHHTRFGHFGEEKKHLECAGYGNTSIRPVVRILVIVSAVLSWFRSGLKSHSSVILNIFVSLQHKNCFCHPIYFRNSK